MFLKSITDIAVEFGEVSAALCGDPREWLDGAAVAAGERGDALVVEVGLEVAGHRLQRRSLLEVGDPVAASRVVSLPLQLRVQNHQRLFPALEGTLDAAWLGPGRTYLSLSLTYEPPLGVVGRMVDQTLLHRVAEVVCQRFLQTLSSELEARASRIS